MHSYFHKMTIYTITIVCKQEKHTCVATYLAVCCLNALRNVSGWNNSDRTSVVLSSSCPVTAFSSNEPSARVFATSNLKYWGGSLGPSHTLSHEAGIYIYRYTHVTVMYVQVYLCTYLLHYKGSDDELHSWRTTFLSISQ